MEENPHTLPYDEIDQIKTANLACANPCFTNSAEPLEGGAGKETEKVELETKCITSVLVTGTSFIEDADDTVCGCYFLTLAVLVKRTLFNV